MFYKYSLYFFLNEYNLCPELKVSLIRQTHMCLKKSPKRFSQQNNPIRTKNANVFFDILYTKNKMLVSMSNRSYLTTNEQH